MNIARLLYLGNVVVDIELDVPALPRRGGDVLARGSQLAPGGGFNVMAAGAPPGLPGAYAGAHGSGPFADLARAGLAAEGIEVLQPARPDTDTGFVVAVVDDTAERTFVTSRGAEATLTGTDLAGLAPRPGGRAPPPRRRGRPVRLQPGAPQQPRRAARLAGPAARGEHGRVRSRPAGRVHPARRAGRGTRPGRLADLQRA